MKESPSLKFNSPEDEIRYLREQIAQQETELNRSEALINTPQESLPALKTLKEYSAFTPKSVLGENYQLSDTEIDGLITDVIKTPGDDVENILQIAHEKGIKNALTVVEKIGSPFLIDEVHMRLVNLIRSGVIPPGLKENIPPWQALHMTLFEVLLPELKKEEQSDQADVVGRMQQWFTGLRNLGAKKSGNHYAIEIAVADNSEDVVFYLAVPRDLIDLFEKQTHSLFPKAVLVEQPNDYNIFVENGSSIVSEAQLRRHALYPLRKFDELQADTMAILLNAFSKIEKAGGGAAVQFLIRPAQKAYYQDFQNIIKKVEKGIKPSEAISQSTVLGSVTSGLNDLFFTKKNTSESEEKTVDQNALDLFNGKISEEIVEVNLRLVVSAREERRAKQIMQELEAVFNQFSYLDGNEFVFKVKKGLSKERGERDFSFRTFDDKKILPLNITELATVVHFPHNDLVPQLKQSFSTEAPAPTMLPTAGTLLGVNRYRGTEKMIFSTPDDRIRHFYIIGQTGTGKTTLMKNMIAQDIQQGNGVCFIDPHGTDIEDILSIVPEERLSDVIYFDPAELDHPLGLNMLEFDVSKPEQKTFVVNEIFSIFKKLYSHSPDSMGPMFEQYFRNATMLVLEDPESGSTLMDVSRVLADADYRHYKLSKATNPIVKQFWLEIAGQAGGEASLQNVVPYIVSKFDVFTANDYLRPIIGQQRSAFNFRQIMDERKILLVNLSKGRLGEINSNLIGMILVGKILMAALSRADNPGADFAPFYLHMDEFQNISTDSISAILSEARKYKLGLTLAHQFIAQLDEGIKEAVFGNVGSLAAFRVGPGDAEFLSRQFEPVFNSNSLMNTPNRQASVRLLMDGVPARPFSLSTLPPPKGNSEQNLRLKKLSALTFGRPRAEIEEEIRLRYLK